MKQIKAPVLFLVFNRPEKTQQVWDVIRMAKPLNLYVSADGARENRPDDKVKCELVRNIVKNVDWECDVKYLFHEKNLGCSLAGKTAFDYVFTNEDRMIELEDDTIPSLSFFNFMDEMLEKYKDDDRIGYVTGQNFMGIQSGKASYFFSHYGGSSGWGTWRRVYKLWDFKLEQIQKAYNPDFIKNFDTKTEYKYWLTDFENYIKNGGNTYDLQSIFLIFEKDLINIIPNRNLITNIGFDADATNSNSELDFKLFANKERFEITEIIHPPKVERNPKIDKKFFQFHFIKKNMIIYRVEQILRYYYHQLKNKFNKNV